MGKLKERENKKEGNLGSSERGLLAAPPPNQSIMPSSLVLNIACLKQISLSLLSLSPSAVLLIKLEVYDSWVTVVGKGKA